jgi:xanthine dehydrogenase FAD-binding subunit
MTASDWENPSKSAIPWKESTDMSLWSRYVSVSSVDAALLVMREADGPSCPVAGGTDLLLELQQGLHPPLHTLVDISAIPELRSIEMRGEVLFLGAAVPIRDVPANPLVREHARAIAKACDMMGGPQVRTSATLGGNVARALPAADGTTALVAMGPHAEIADSHGRRLVPLLDLYRGPGQSALAAGREILVGFHIPARRPGQSSDFGRIMRPQGVALPILNAAVWLERQEERIHDIRIVVAPAGPVPVRAVELENALRGRTFDERSVEAMLLMTRTSLRLRTSPQRATADYRYLLSEVLLRDIVMKAWESAGMVEMAA